MFKTNLALPRRTLLLLRGFAKSFGGKAPKGDARAGLGVECQRRFQASVALPEPQRTPK